MVEERTSRLITLGRIVVSAILAMVLVVPLSPVALADESFRAAPTVSIPEGTSLPLGVDASLVGKFDTTEPLPVWGQVWIEDREFWSGTAKLTTTADGSYSIPLTFRSAVPGTYSWRAAAEFPDGEIQYSDAIELVRVDSIRADPIASQPVGVAGALTGSIAAPVGASVWAEIWLPDLGRWSGTPRVRPAADGAFSVPLVFQMDRAGTTTWRPVVLFADGTVRRGSQLQFVRTSAGNLKTPAARPVGVQGTLSGKIVTSRAVPVWGEVWIAAENRWSRAPSVQSRADGTFAVPLVFQMGRQGTTMWRVGARLANGSTVHTNQVSFTRTPAGTVENPLAKPVGMPGVLKGKFSTTQATPVWGEVWIPSQNRWSRTARVQSSSNGAYAIPLTFQMSSRGNTTWRVGAEHVGGAVEYTRQVVFTRTAAATVSSPGRLATGVEGALAGKVSTPRAVDVWAEVWVNGESRWSRTPARRSAANGTYSIPLNYQMNVVGDTTWRVAARHIDGSVEYTRQVTLTRTAAPNVDRRCLTGRVLCASKTTNQMHWMINGRIIETVDVRYGRPGLETREGVFQVGWKSRHHVSSIYGTRMPYSMFFSGGQAVHYSDDFARRGWNGGSGGCINVRDEATLAKIYSQVRVGDRVVVYW